MTNKISNWVQLRAVSWITLFHLVSMGPQWAPVKKNPFSPKKNGWRCWQTFSKQHNEFERSRYVLNHQTLLPPLSKCLGESLFAQAGVPWSRERSLRCRLHLHVSKSSYFVSSFLDQLHIRLVKGPSTTCGIPSLLPWIYIYIYIRYG